MLNGLPFFPHVDIILAVMGKSNLKPREKSTIDDVVLVGGARVSRCLGDPFQ